MIPGTNPPVESILANEVAVDDVIYFDGVRCKVIAIDHGKSNKGIDVGRFQLVSAPKGNKDRKLMPKSERLWAGGPLNRNWFREKNTIE